MVAKPSPATGRTCEVNEVSLYLKELPMSLSQCKFGGALLEVIYHMTVTTRSVDMGGLNPSGGFSLDQHC